MMREKLFRNLTWLVVLIFIVNYFANKFYWYYSIWWFDMPMHFSGGLWLGAVYVWWRLRGDTKVTLDKSTWPSVVGWVLLVGVGWEVFEYFFINYMALNAFDLLDTLSDLFFDLLGGCLAVWYLGKFLINK